MQNEIRDNGEREQDINVLEIGDLKITSTRNSLKSVVNTAKSVLRDETFNRYLNVDLPKKKILGLGGD